MKSVVSAVCMLVVIALFSSCAIGDGNYVPGHYRKRTYMKQHVRYGKPYYNHYAPARHGTWNTRDNPYYR